MNDERWAYVVVRHPAPYVEKVKGTVGSKGWLTTASGLIYREWYCFRLDAISVATQEKRQMIDDYVGRLSAIYSTPLIHESAKDQD